MRERSARDSARRGRGRARAARVRRPESVVDHVVGATPVPVDPGRPEPVEAQTTSSRSAKRSGSRCTSRWRATNASACSAKTSPTPTRDVHRRSAGQGRRVRHHVRAAARVRRRPLLQHAARGSEHHRPRGRPGDARPAAVRRDPVLRLRVARDEPAQVGGGDHALAFERRVHVPDGRAHPDRRLPPGRRDLPQPVGRIDLRARARTAHRVPVAGARRGRPLAHRVPLRRPRALPRAQASLPPGLQPRSDAARGLDVAVRQGRVRDAWRSRDGRHVGRDRAPRANSRSASWDADAGRRDHRPPHDRAVGPRHRGRVGAQDRPGPRGARGHAHVRFRRRDRRVRRRRMLRVPRRAGAGGSRRADTFCAYEPSLEDAILPQVADIERDLAALLAY